MDQKPAPFNPEKWYVRTPDGATYGPASPLELVGWAAEARIVPGCLVSRDGVNWEPAEAMPRLRMEWTVELGPDDKIGPLNLLAIGDLVREGTISPGSVLACSPRNLRTTIDSQFFGLLLQEARDNLSGAAEEESRLLRQIQEQWIPASRADSDARDQVPAATLADEQARWKAQEQTWEARQAQWQAAEQAWEAKQAQWVAAEQAGQAQRQASEQAWEAKQAQWAAAEQAWEARAAQWQASEAAWTARQAQWAAAEQSWLAKEAQWQTLQTAWQAEQAQLNIALETAAAERRQQAESLVTLQNRLETLRQESDRERLEFAQVRQKWIADLDEKKTRLDQLESVHEEALRSLDQLRASQGVARQKLADLERRYQDETAALIKARDEALQSVALLKASLDSADQERTGLRAELDASRNREVLLRMDLADRTSAEETHLKLIEQARAETASQTRMADELREELSRQSQARARLAEELTQCQQMQATPQPPVVDSALLNESEVLEQECSHLAGVLDQLAVAEPAPPATAASFSVMDWIDPRPASANPSTAASPAPSAPVAHRIQVAVTALRQAEKELAKQRQIYQDLIRRSADRETELTALVDRQKRDLEMSSRLVTQSMEEIEKRESELRQLRRNAAGAPPPPTVSPVPQKPVTPVEPEVLPPVQSEKPPVKLARDVPLRDPKKVLVDLEKQARADLHKWKKQQAQVEPGTIDRLKKWISRD